MTVRAAIGLGSNLGDRPVHLSAAVEAIEALGSVVAVSSSYETAPIGGPEQGPYLNGVVVLETDLSPATLMDSLLAIEKSRGRERRVRWGPRTLDLDILLYGDKAIDQRGLTVPHPGLADRRFALEPLVEVWPNARLPDGTLARHLLKKVQDQQVSRFTDAPSRIEFPRWAPLALFLLVGLGAVALWWLMGLVL